MKRIVALILTVLMMCSVLILPVSAVEQTTVQPRFVDIYSISAALKISDLGIATCSSDVSTLTQNNTIHLTMQLEQLDGNRWVIEKSWSNTYGPDAGMTKYRAVSSGYYYRVFIAATVFDSNGNAVETVGQYSQTIYH